MSNNIEMLLIGAGYMAKEHYKVLKELNTNITVIGRGGNSAKSFSDEMGCTVLTGDLDENLKKLDSNITHAIIAVNVEELSNATLKVISCGVKNILVEKPAGISIDELQKIVNECKLKNTNVFVAYNRRFYSSVEKAQEIIRNDGGVTSFNFEFTEWSHVIKDLSKSDEVKEAWFLANSTHVIDMAFYLGGHPKEMSSFQSGELSWHSRGSIYCGAGISDKDALFSYQANWNAPGRWGIEILTENHRLYFRPLEKLMIQEIGSVKLSDVDIDDTLDIKYKPGVYKMLNAFVNDTTDCRLAKIQDQLSNFKDYFKIERQS